MLRQNANSNSMSQFKKKIMTGFLCNGTRVKCMEKSGGVFESNLNNGIVYIYFKAEKKIECKIK